MANRLRDPDRDLRLEVEALRAEVASLSEPMDAVAGRVAQGFGGKGEGVDMADLDEGDDDEHRRIVPAPSRVLPE